VTMAAAIPVAAASAASAPPLAPAPAPAGRRIAVAPVSTRRETHATAAIVGCAASSTTPASRVNAGAWTRAGPSPPVPQGPSAAAASAGATAVSSSTRPRATRWGHPVPPAQRRASPRPTPAALRRPGSAVRAVRRVPRTAPASCSNAVPVATCCGDLMTNGGTGEGLDDGRDCPWCTAQCTDPTPGWLGGVCGGAS
jgi:hypothetical protein